MWKINLHGMAKIKRIEKIKENKTIEEELEEELEREIHGQYTIFPLIGHKKQRGKNS